MSTQGHKLAGKDINGVFVDDTFAEAFGMSGTGIIITADTLKDLCHPTRSGTARSVLPKT